MTGPDGEYDPVASRVPGFLGELKPPISREEFLRNRQGTRGVVTRNMTRDYDGQVLHTQPDDSPGTDADTDASKGQENEGE